MIAVGGLGALGLVALRQLARGSRPVKGLGSEPTSEGTDADLDLMFAQIEALRELAGDRQESTKSGQIYDFSVRWGTFMAGRMQRLHFYHGRSELSESQEARYQELCEELGSVEQLIDRLGLAPAEVAFEHVHHQPA